MKKALLWGVLATLFFASCSMNELGVESTIEPCSDFVAQFSNETRTSLDGTAVVWNAEDQLTIFTKTEHNRQYKVKDLSEDGRTATFGYVNYTGTSSGAINSNYAVYPYNAEATISGDVISTALAAEQVYNAERVDISYALMVAKSASNNLAFVNAGALMRFNISKSEILPDSYTLASITLTSAANNIAGDVTIDLGADSKAVVSSNGSKEVTLTAINTEITTDVQSFYVALPATNFADKDLSVSFTFADGVKTFALPAFELHQGSIKTIAYTINDSEDFTGTTPDNGEGETPDAEPKPASNEIWYTNGSTTEATTPNATDVFGANIVSNLYDETKECWVITFDGDVTSIGEGAFAGCLFNLTSINIPEGVTSIGNSAFRNCILLELVTIPESVISIGKDVFYCGETPCLKEFKGKFASQDGRCLIVDGTLVAFAPAGLTEYVIPEGVTSIGEGAFAWLCGRYLKSITIPEGVTSIGNYAFDGCSSLTSINIPVGVTSIGMSAFRGCSSLTSINIPEGVTSIGVCAFDGCWSLTSITIPESVTSIGYQAFYSCSSLTSITIPEGVTSIGFEAFYECSSLKSVTIPESVTSIGSNVFRYCSSLTSVYCKATTPPYMDNWGYAFNNNALRRKIYVPAGSVEAYKAAKGWSTYADDIVGYNF